MQNYFSPVDLRPLEIDDGPMLFEWRSNENVWKNFATKTPPTIEKHSEWLTENINSHAKRVFIAEIIGSAVGLIKFYKQPHKNTPIFWSFYLDPDLKGKGVGALVEWRALDYFFYDIAEKELNCLVFDENLTVINLHRRFGFQVVKNSVVFEPEKTQNTKITHLTLTCQNWAKIRPSLSQQLIKVSKKIPYFNKL